jgi:hypothetical protein
VTIEIKLIIAILCIVGSPILRKYMEKKKERERKEHLIDIRGPKPINLGFWCFFPGPAMYIYIAL